MGFRVEVRTVWAPEARARRRLYARLSLDVLMALGGTNTASANHNFVEPRWTVEILEDDELLVASPEMTEWAEVEQLRDRWQARVLELGADQVRLEADSWR